MTAPEDGTEILDLLAKGGYLTPNVRSAVARFAKRWELSHFHALLMTRAVSEADLADAVAKGLGIHRLFHVPTLTVDEECLKIIGFRRARLWECLVLKTEDGAFDLVFADPTQHERTRQLKQELKRDLTLSVSERSDIVGAIDELFPLAEQLPSLFHQDRP